MVDRHILRELEQARMAIANQETDLAELLLIIDLDRTSGRDVSLLEDRRSRLLLELQAMRSYHHALARRVEDRAPALSV